MGIPPNAEPSRPVDPYLFVSRVERRRKALNLRSDELAGILGGVFNYAMHKLALVSHCSWTKDALQMQARRGASF